MPEAAPVTNAVFRKILHVRPPKSPVRSSIASRHRFSPSQCGRRGLDLALLASAVGPLSDQRLIDRTTALPQSGHASAPRECRPGAKKQTNLPRSTDLSVCDAGRTVRCGWTKNDKRSAALVIASSTPQTPSDTAHFDISVDLSNSDLIGMLLRSASGI